MNRLSLKNSGLALMSFFVISYILCILFDLVFEQWAMYQFWEIVLPGFKWLSWGTFFIGLIDVIAYAWYTALVFVPLYNYFNSPEKKD